MWTYYKQSYPNGVWLLFREDEGSGRDESFHRKEGWRESEELSIRRRKGDIASDDIIPEAEAETLIRTLPDFRSYSST